MTPDLRPLNQVDRVIHEPVRLQIMTYLSLVESADFLFLQRELQVTQGNLGAHLMSLERSGYVRMEKTFVNRKPRTTFQITPAGMMALLGYWRIMRDVLQWLPSDTSTHPVRT